MVVSTGTDGLAANRWCRAVPLHSSWSLDASSGLGSATSSRFQFQIGWLSLSGPTLLKWHSSDALVIPVQGPLCQLLACYGAASHQSRFTARCLWRPGPGLLGRRDCIQREFRQFLPAATEIVTARDHLRARPRSYAGLKSATYSESGILLLFPVCGPSAVSKPDPMREPEARN